MPLNFTRMNNQNQEQIESINIYTDGGSRGNPGQAALGVYIENDKREMLDEIGISLGVNTNNIAEYSAIVEGMNWILRNLIQMPNLKKINFFMDSLLACSQLNGIYKIKNAGLRELYFKIKQKEQEINLPIYYTHIPREQNKKADRMVNLALDNKLSLA
jgi:ribonuclease HI